MLNWFFINLILLFLFIPISKIGLSQQYVDAISSTIFANMFLKLFTKHFKLYPVDIKYWVFSIPFDVVVMLLLQLLPGFYVSVGVVVGINLWVRVISAIMVVVVSTTADILIKDFYRK